MRTIDDLNEAGLRQAQEHMGDILRRLRIREQRAAEDMVRAEAELNDVRKLIAFAQIYQADVIARLGQIEKAKQK